MKYGYARVSTRLQSVDGNSLEAQERQLKEAGAEIIVTEAASGAKGERKELSALLKKLKTGDALIITKLDRLARSVTKGISVIDDLLIRNITINVLNMGIIDNNSPTGRLTRTILLAFAEFERDAIIERTQAGKAVAKQKPGFREGRPRKYKEQQLMHALYLLENYSYSQVSGLTGISVSTLKRYKKKQNGKNIGV